MKHFLVTLLAVLLIVGGANAYTVVQGDNLSKIAENADMSLAELLSMNPQIENPNLIYPGDDLDLGEDLGMLGGTTPIAGTTYNLAGSGVSSSATSIILQSLTIPQTGYEILTSDLSGTFYITLEPGNKTRQEIVSCTTVAQSVSNTTATLSGCTRGLKPIYPYTTDSDYNFSHAGGSQVIFSNPPQLYEKFTATDNNEAITGFWDFTYLPTSSATPTSTSHLVTKTYVDNSVNQGAATSTESTAGISELATQNEMASSTPWGITEPHVIQSQYATSTPSGGTSAAKYVVVSEADGKLNQLWLDLTEGYTFSGGVGFTGQVDIAGALGNVYSNYLGGSFNIGWSAVTMENATGTLNVLGDTFMTGNATTTGDLDIGGDAEITGSLVTPGGLEYVYAETATTIRISADTERTTTSSTYEKVKEIEVGVKGVVNAYVEIKSTQSGGDETFSRIYINGVAAVAENSTTGNTYSAQNDDVTVAIGDLVQVYIKNAADTGYAKNFRLRYDTYYKNDTVIID